MANNTTSLPGVPHYELTRSRRDFLARAGAGFGALAMSYLMGAESKAAPSVARGQFDALSPLAPRLPHYAARAQSVIFLFMEGGPSHLDLFDPKPKLEQLAGKPLPASFGPIITAMGEYGAPIMASRRKW